MAEKSNFRTGFELSATVIAVSGAVWAGVAYFESWMQNAIDKAVEEKVVVIEQLQLADLLVYYGYPDDAIAELRKIADRMSGTAGDDRRRIAFYDNYLGAVTQSGSTLKYEPEIRMLKAVFSTEMQTDGWHDEHLAYAAMFLPEARADTSFFEGQVIGRLNLAIHQYEADGDFEGLESAYHTLALAYLCRGDMTNAQAAIGRAAEMLPFEYYLINPLIGFEELAEDPEIRKLNAVCAHDVSRGYGDLLEDLTAYQNPIGELFREYTE